MPGERRLRQDDVLNLDAVVTDEAPSEVVERLAELRPAADRLVNEIVEAKTKIGPFDRDGRSIGMIRRRNVASGEAARQIDPAVRTERRMADAKLIGRSSATRTLKASGSLPRVAL